MSDDDFPTPPIGKRWADAEMAPWEFRMLALERDRQDHEIRIRQVERTTLSMDAKLDKIVEQQTDAKQSAVGTRLAIVGGVVLTVLTIIGSHIAWH